MKNIEVSLKRKFKMKFNHNQIKEVLPYDYPFLLIDTIEDMQENKIIAKKNLSQDQQFFKGHFRDFPIMPGVLILEAMGQTGSFYIRKKSKNKKIDVLAYEIQNAKFLNPAFPGDTLHIKINLEKVKKNIWIAKGEVFTDEKIIAKGDFYLYVTKQKEFREKCL